MTTTFTTNFYILDQDKQLARARIAELEREILQLGPAFHDALNQTSETWHDNAPFDALRERQAVLAAELQHLKEILSKSAPSVPTKAHNGVHIGARVRLQHIGKQALHHYLLAGHWSYRLGEIIDNAMVISCQSPLGAALLGRSLGDIVTLPNKQQLAIIGIDE